MCVSSPFSVINHLHRMHDHLNTREIRTTPNKKKGTNERTFPEDPEGEHRYTRVKSSDPEALRKKYACETMYFDFRSAAGCIRKRCNAPHRCSSSDEIGSISTAIPSLQFGACSEVSLSYRIEDWIGSQQQTRLGSGGAGVSRAHARSVTLDSCVVGKAAKCH